jgi:23S rRNA (cytosine1962-C5)-methyltransferase
MQAQVVIKPGRERSLRRGHPWLMSGAVEAVRGAPLPGATVDIVDGRGEWFARAAYSPSSQIRCRVWSFSPDEAIDAAFFRQRLLTACEVRQRAGLSASGDTAMRLVNAESDGLPGVIIDRYADVLVGQFLSVGAEAWKQVLVDAAMDVTGCRSFYERSDSGAREREGLPEACGRLGGDEPPALVTITEGTAQYLVDVRTGHKTGFYLDQRENRALVAAACRGLEVLNCFCYTGGFGIAALHGGATMVTQVDVSATALDLARRNAELNGFGPERSQVIEADVFHELRRMRDRRAAYDVIVLDPPKFADTRSQLEGACRGYKDINLLAFKLVRPGGSLFTFSCSGAMTPELFYKVVAEAAADAHREGCVVRELSQGADHPRLLRVPETHYLNGLHVTVR